MKGIIYTAVALVAFSSTSLMALDFCTKGLPEDARKELAEGKTDGKVATFGRCIQKAAKEKAEGKAASDPNFVAAAGALLKSREGRALAQHIGYH